MIEAHLIHPGFKQAKRAVKMGATAGLGLAAEHVLQVSNTHVPIEEGTLERSGATSVDAGAGTAAISYDTPYAAVQHEDLTFHHDAGRHAKFLETAGNTERAQVRELIAASIRKQLGS